MTEEKEFIRWLLFVACLILGVGKGIPAALILASHEPMPPLAYETDRAITEGWDLPREYGQNRLLEELNWQMRLIEQSARKAMK